jgi:hypothetical protein
MNIFVFLLVFIFSNVILFSYNLCLLPIFIQILFFMQYMGFVAFFTQWIAYNFLNPVKSSALIGLVIGLFLQMDIQPQILQLNVFTVSFGATFVGMCSIKILNGWGVFIAGSLFGFIALFTLQNLSFIGGAMGALACLCCLVIINVLKIKQWKKDI